MDLPTTPRPHPTISRPPTAPRAAPTSLSLTFLLPPLLLATLLLAILLILLPSLATAAPPLAADTITGAASASARAVQIRPARGPIEIDGHLDDAGWQGAARITDFVERTPREGAEPPVATEVLLTYDESTLYVAFIARDPDPGAIRAALQPRDQLWSDDWVGILLDPHGDASVGYYLLSNPIGVQGDLQLTTRSEDSSIDFVYQTAGRITDEGFIVEMAIPFRSLRVPDRAEHDWRIMLVRTWPRSNRHYITWPAWSRNNACQLCEMGSLEGLQGIRSGGNLEVLPSLTASRGGGLDDATDPDSFRSGAVRAQPSLGLKYTLERGWTAEATVNPDFSQVESDAAQIDVNTTFALFFPERRPFFQEGMDLYQTPINTFYSRSINAPRGAAKLTGREGRTSIGWIGAWDEHTPLLLPFSERTAVVQAGESFTNVLRVQHNMGASHLGGLVTDRRLDGGGSGTTAGIDGQFRFGEMYNLMAHLVVSHTREPDDPGLSAGLPDVTFGDDEYTAAFDGESFTGHAAFLRFARDARTWSWNVLYLEASPTYRADSGFQTRNDFRRATGWTGVTFFPNRYGVERVSASLFGGSYWNFDGVRTLDTVEPQVSVALPGQTQVGGAVAFRTEVFRDVRLTGVRDQTVWLNTAFTSWLQGAASFGTGRRVARTLQVPEVGSGRNAMVSATVKPWQRLTVQPSLSWQRLELDDGTELFSGYIARTRASFQYNRELNLRMVLQYNDFSGRLDLEPLVVYQINPFTIFYVGSTHGSSRFDDRGFVETDRQYFAKFQYLFRR